MPLIVRYSGVSGFFTGALGVVYHAPVMAEQASYEVRTPPLFWVAGGAMLGLAGLTLGLGMMFASSLAAFAAAGVFLVLGVMFALDSAYRVGAGRHLIRFHDDRLELPPVTGRAPLVFRRGETAITLKRQVVRVRFMLVPVGDLPRGTVVEVRGGGVTRKLSTLVLANRDDASYLIADLERFTAGEAAIGRVTPVVPRTEYDDKLDRELAEMD